MRVKLSGSVELLEEVQAAMAAADPSSIEQSVRKREDAELRFGLHDLADLTGSVKHLVDVAPILFAAGVAFWAKVSGRPTPGKAKPTRLTIDVTAPLKQLQVTITPTSTVEEIKIQLAQQGTTPRTRTHKQ